MLKNVFWLYYWIVNSLIIKFGLIGDGFLLLFIINYCLSFFIFITETSEDWNRYGRYWKYLSKLKFRYLLLENIIKFYVFIFLILNIYLLFYYLELFFSSIITIHIVLLNEYTLFVLFSLLHLWRIISFIINKKIILNKYKVDM
ncbi:MAG: hypothetical protein COU81_00155 [Candidatus Portnoybacteria bacterium CG10_big_fil_rev_8_21_14_0_10_36_7]|uniref:Uncharacterized protein n=1 Tax=Candidatus Portnoybacteria bacterium CG10_big_fil_rev_8_21_14_0_10_36_7 TaxID=1974812 RepID=A0A2M8KF43_9BACT|nr:MAG: hypothetical protein COU81_00155 [Candidatus Portnoybacteria bacterium CG10_big_fil_rev_8_21_14_0_10_36_7]